MTRYERRIYQVGVACAAVMLIAITATLADECSAKKGPFQAETTETEEITEETETEPETAENREHNANQRTQRVETLEETDEPETEKQVERESTERAEDADPAFSEHQAIQQTEAAPEVESMGAKMENRKPIYYRIAGDMIPEEIQTALHEALDAEGIGFWYEGALCQVFQESHGNPAAENPNGLDKGLLQYRTTYWPATAAAYGEAGADIFDWQAQLRVYARQTAARLNAGLTADETISRHKTSDSCPALDTAYIQQVRQWLGQMEEQR